MIATTRTVGPPTDTVSDSKPFPGKRRKLLSTNVFGLCAKSTSKESHELGVHESVAYTKVLKHFGAGFSVHLQYWCYRAGNHADAQGQQMLATISLNFPSSENAIISHAFMTDIFTEHIIEF